MKKITLLICILICLPALSQTNVSGVIDSNTSWDIVGSPYIVDGNLLVQSGATLTIDAGVEVKFDSSKTLQIDGDMIAIGDALNMIQFTANILSPSAGFWNHIHFTSSSTPAILSGDIYESGSTLQYCNIEYGGGLTNGNLKIDNAGPYISNCTIKYGSSHGIYLQESSSLIENCAIKHNVGAGIYSDHDGIHHDFNLQYNDISNNQGGGIYIDEMWQNTIYIMGNNISKNSFSGIFINSSGGSGNGTIYIEENLIYQNSASQGGGIFIDGGFDLNINCNTIQNNQAVTGSALYNYRGSNPYTNFLSNNKIINNVASNGDLIYLFYSTSYDQSFDITDNYIYNNTSTFGSIFNIVGGITVDVFNISNNSIKQNYGDNTFELYDFYGHINNNNLFNNTAYEIFNNNEAGELTIDAENNYWHTTEIADIESKIYDWFDNATLSIVEYSPILDSEIYSEVLCSPQEFSSIGSEEELVKEDGFNLFPNPFKDSFTLTISNYNPGVKYELVIYAMDGKEVMKIENITQQTSIDVRKIKSGLYVYMLISNGLMTHTGKLIAK